MSLTTEADIWQQMDSALSEFQCRDWMNLARSVSKMLAHYKRKYLDLSIYNFVYNKNTKECRLIDANDAQHNNDPIKLRWYPPGIWNDLNKMWFYYDITAALVVLEFIYEKSPFYHEDENIFKENIKRRIRTAGTPAEKDRKAVWMLMVTAFVGNRLVDGRAYLDIISRSRRAEPDDVIANWEDTQEDWGPPMEKNWYDKPPSCGSEHDSGISPEPEEGQAESETEGSSPQLAAAPEPQGLTAPRPSD